MQENRGFDKIKKTKKTKGLTLLERSRTRPSDEYYTKAETVEEIEEAIRPFISGRKIWCPFDADCSQFVRVLKAKGYDVINTADDYKNHLQEIKASGAVVVSNPPFSIWRAILRDFQEIDVDFFLMNNLLNTIAAFQKGTYGMYLGSLYFDTQDGEEKGVPCFLMSNKDIRGLQLRQNKGKKGGNSRQRKEIDGVPFWRLLNEWRAANRPTPAFLPSTFVLSEEAKVYDFEITDKTGYFHPVLVKGRTKN